MSEILSQEEIEALLASLSTSEEGDSSASGADPFSSPSGGGGGFVRPDVPKRPVSYEVYDFRRPDKFSKDQLRTLQMLHETFSRLCASALSAYLRSQVHLELISLEQVPYEEYLRSINRSVFTVFSLPPLSGQAVLELEFSLVFSMIDRLLGGPGRTVARTNLTDIERPLVAHIMDRTFASLRSSWEGIIPLNPSIDSMETSSQFVQIAPPTDIVVTILFEVRVGEQRGAMSLCVPYQVLKPITQKLSAQKWFATGTKKVQPLHRSVLATQVSRTKLPCTALLGRTKMNIRDFIELRPGDLLHLDQQVKRDIPLLVSTTPKFEGKPALNGKKLVFRISRALEE